jgi:hypothetical protein
MIPAQFLFCRFINNPTESRVDSQLIVPIQPMVSIVCALTLLKCTYVFYH